MKYFRFVIRLLPDSDWGTIVNENPTVRSLFLVFLSSLGLLIFSIGNPHILVFNTKSDRYSVFFFQWRSNKDNISATLSNIGIAMSEFLVSGEFVMPKITYNIGRIGDNIGRIGDTVATDSVVMEDQVQTSQEEE